MHYCNPTRAFIIGILSAGTGTISGIFDCWSINFSLSSNCSLHRTLRPPFSRSTIFVCDLKCHTPLPYKYGEMQSIDILSGTWPTTLLPCKTATMCKSRIFPTSLHHVSSFRIRHPYIFIYMMTTNQSLYNKNCKSVLYEQ